VNVEQVQYQEQIRKEKKSEGGVAGLVAVFAMEMGRVTNQKSKRTVIDLILLGQYYR
jgi:hypothetical protein